MMIEVLKAGLETSIQDWPGRHGYWNQGFPPSGPMDSWSFRLANVLVGNEVSAAALECQYMGPTLKFLQETCIAITGADMRPLLDGEPQPMWQSLTVKAGQTLTLQPPKMGVRTYIAVAGGIHTPPWLGSRATFAKASVGGLDGHALRVGDRLAAGGAVIAAGRRISSAYRPPLIETSRSWEIEVVRGPNDDWIDDAGHDTFLGSDWRLSGKSDRTGFRLEGPPFTFTHKAYDKAPENGSEPSNIIDQGYPIGGINIAGQTPIILVNDGPSMGGFINPYTVPSAAFWKLGQSRPGDIYRFKAVSVEQAQALARELAARCTLDSLE